MQLPSIKILTKKNLSGKCVLLRLDLNVPLDHGEVTDAFRITQSLPTLRYLVERGAKVIVVSHLGSDGEQSLKPIAAYVNEFVPVTFISVVDDLSVVRDAKPGSVFILENIRREKGEMTNSLTLAKKLAGFADLYVNDAFSASHRAHASILGVAKLLPSHAGLLLEKEVLELSKAFNPKHPFLFILGGAKFGTKVPLIKKFLKTADSVFLGGALVHVIFKKKRYEIGKSLFDKNVTDLEPIMKNPKLFIPVDVVTQNEAGYYVRPPNGVGKEDYIYDAGPDTVALLREKIEDAKFILWNGPLGNFEQGYDKATLEVAKAITRSDAYSIIGGGDTIAAISRMGIPSGFNFVSTGGGAMLDFLAKGTLPGLSVLIKKTKTSSTRKRKSAKTKARSKIH